MQENEFEKKLQQQMDELQLRPAAELWPRIQVAVAKQNGRKKRVLFFIVFCALSLIAFLVTDSSLFLNNNNKQAGTAGKSSKENTAAVSPVLINTLPPQARVDSNLPGPAQAAPRRLDASEAKKLPSAVILPVDNNSLQDALAGNKKERSGKGSSAVSVTPAINNDDVAISSYKKIRRNSAASVRTTVTNNQPDELQDAVETVAIVQQKPTATAATPAVTTNDEQVKEAAADTKKEAPVTAANATGKNAVSEVPQPGTNKPTQQKTKQSALSGAGVWGLSIALSGGITSAGNNYNNSNKSLAYTSNNGNPGTVTGSPGGIVEYPSATKPGGSLEIAIKVYRTLSTKSKIITGLQYRLLTTSVKTGNISDSGAAAPTRDVVVAGTINQYRNYHHFISVPVSFSTSIFPIGRSDITLDAGVDFSRLISTNSLQFNLARPAYYKDNTLFNKTIVGLSAAVAINIASKKRALFSIGPEFYYSLTPLASSGMYAKSHYQYVGIRLQKNLTK